MKVSGLFSGGTLIGRVSGGCSYIYGVEVNTTDSGFYTSPIEVKSLKVYKKRNCCELNPKGQDVELIRREGCTAIIKDAYDREHVALLCNTMYMCGPNRLTLQDVLVTQVERQFNGSRYKKRWVIW